MKKILCTFLLSLLLPGRHSAQQPSCILLNDNTQLYTLGNLLQVYEDEKGDLTFEDIHNTAFQKNFSLSMQKSPNYGMTSSAVWCKFCLENKSGDQWILEIGNTSLEHIALFALNDDGTYGQINSGNYLSIAQREFKNNNYLFRLSLPKDKAKIFYLRVQSGRILEFPLKVGTIETFFQRNHLLDIWQGVYIGFMLMMVLYNFFIYFSVRDRAYLYYVLYIACMGSLNASIKGYSFELLWQNHPWINNYEDIITSCAGLFAIFFTTNFLHTRVNTPRLHKVLYLFIAMYLATIVFVLAGNTLIGTIGVEVSSFFGATYIFFLAIYIYKIGYKPAGFYLLAWGVLLLSIIIFVLKDSEILQANDFTGNSLQVGSAIEALLLSFALANKINVLKEENQKLILRQNELLEIKVEERTRELKQTLDNLRLAQNQLIQSEKMASLGQLTAGIAHEIQNPLNFVNNFSDLSRELIEEIKQGKNKEEVTAVLTELQNNLQKISMHGKRADGIVKNMLQHSRSSRGEKQKTDINKLCEEFLNLAYHGMRAKDVSFNCSIQKVLDNNLPQINIVPQDIGRVLLNLINNAFYAVKERYEQRKTGDENYMPTVTLVTSTQSHFITVRVKDNGRGVPEDLRNKIFQPFFTTKPTGEGTGLGLSLSYDIITKGHNGELKMESKEGEGTEFILSLPTA